MAINTRSAMRTISWNEVRENSASQEGVDAWIVINGYVYDVTKFVDVHPGGHYILQAAGSDATSYFYTMHSPLKVDKILEKASSLIIGKLSEAESLYIDRKSMVSHMHTELRQRLGKKPKHPWTVKLSVFVQITSWFVAFFAAYVQGSIIAALVLMCIDGQVHNIIHAASHGMIFDNPDLTQKAITFLSWLNNSAAAYYGGKLYTQYGTMKHFPNGIHFGHHTYCGNDAVDPEVYGFRKSMWDKIELRTNLDQERKYHHRFQHLYYIPARVWVKVYLPSFVKPLQLCRTTIRVAVMHRIAVWEKAMLLSKILFEFLLGSATLGGSGYPLLAFLLLPFRRALLVASIHHQWLTWPMMMGVLNLADTMHWTSANPLEHHWNPSSSCWASMQIAYSNDLHWIAPSKSFFGAIEKFMMKFWDFGSSYQCIHHIFPGLSPAYYPLAQNIIQEQCAACNLVYHTNGQMGALFDRLDFLRTFGTS